MPPSEAKPLRLDSAECLDLIQNAVGRFRQMTVETLDYYDFGLEPELLERYWKEIEGLLPRFARACTRAEGILGRLAAIEGPAWDSGRPADGLRQSLVHMAGALATIPRVGAAFDAPDLENALLAKFLYQNLAELLDDVIDGGTYSPSAAQAIYGQVLGSLGTASYPEAEAIRCLQRFGASHARLLAGIGASLNEILLTAPRWAEVDVRFRQRNRRLALAQSWSVLFKDFTAGRMDLRDRALTLSDPEPDIKWFETLARAMGHVSNMALLDLGFARFDPFGAGLEEDRRAWSCYDIVIDTLDHLFDLRRDCSEGITNLALWAMRPENSLLGGSAVSNFGTLRIADYENLISRLATWASRAVAHGARSGVASSRYRFLNAVIPIVMFASSKDQNQDLLAGVLRAFALANRSGSVDPSSPPTMELTAYPAVRVLQSTMYSQYSSPVRTQRVLTTRPTAPRALRIPS